MTSLSLIAPAKLNLFLHINGRRADGYHELETLFVFLNYGDQLDFTVNPNGQIQLSCDNQALANNDNLIIKAARALKEHSHALLGVDIHLTKRLPMGGGVGGGSSDAATTLLALNQLWQCGYTLDQLAEIGLTLGADVPVFVRGFAAIAHGIGEQLEAVDLPPSWYLVVHPNVHISTQAIFTHPDLPRDTPKLSGPWQSAKLYNDCESLVKKLAPEVEKTLLWLLEYAPSRMTGTGACCFASFAEEADALKALNALPAHWQGFVAQSVNLSPAHLELNAKLNLL
ncbi:4-diphosphocytidyl-2-C-methyl-D-erythritol kinase [Pseudoalteromonas ulvae UL12]|uniref:4-diphosphocytidyl-2-C-methyl-D-erythritol kinase n=1 Tax=Pseudoalteromonas ulvae TaxID=107327 RepID=A0A244CV83_PSEDV|nr:4-(cytidine 5'-diphospho)-2-C-methyl-D-erythritol kinase [Pseudoalteromonas ulvae]MBE0362493.1 4-diphosphocytidyl-2-C-methyl-D-erythritol kinase [Pseudoalteromonas ulvae UL12]OUL59543.1 4-(cytidine 5'-diphospho)-2-C-methyl-D-erythritol kinase [Pseudoalteromonas ulvae]